MMKTTNSIKQALNQLLVTLIGGHRQRWQNKRRMFQKARSMDQNPRLPRN